MKNGKLAGIGFDPQDDSFLLRLGEMNEKTETIDLNSLFGEHLTSSGSYDLRRVKFASFGSFLEALSVPTLLIDRLHQVVFANAAFTSLTAGLDPVGGKFSSIFSNPLQSRDFELLTEKVFHERKPEVRERKLKIEHMELWARLHLRTLRLGSERFVLVQIENLTAEKELDAIGKYKQLIEIFPIGMAEFSVTWPLSTDLPIEGLLDSILESRLVDGNTQFAKMYGRTAIKNLAGLPLGNLLPRKSVVRELLQKWIRTGFAALSFETKEAKSPNETKHFENTIIGNVRDDDLVGLWWLKKDVTEKKKMEEEILTVRKLESIGTLAGGIAHDFNNLLTAVLGNISLGRLNSTLSEKSDEKFRAAAAAANRAQDLTRQLLTFSKGGAPIKSSSDLAELLKECVGFVLRGSNVDCKFSFSENLWPVEMDVGQISQVVANLVINAVDAMPNGGTLRVIAGNVSKSGRAGLPLKEGDYVQVTVADSGEGIPKAHLAMIFDPYFTTKDKGTGLGLATSHSIVRKHGGLITVRSRLGVGSSFQFFLPAARNAPQEPKKGIEELIKGQGRILIMDDEDVVLETTGDLVRELGYEATLVRDGMEAVDAYRNALSDDRRFDAVILDLTIRGGIGGKEALVKLRELDANVRAIVSSGYSNESVMADHSTMGFNGVLPKPYTARQLSEVLDGVIGTGPESTSQATQEN